MPSQRQHRDDEGPQEADIERFGGETAPCRKCGAAMYDDAEWCHQCGHVEPKSEAPLPKWVVVTAASTACLLLYLLLF